MIFLVQTDFRSFQRFTDFKLDVRQHHYNHVIHVKLSLYRNSGEFKISIIFSKCRGHRVFETMHLILEYDIITLSVLFNLIIKKPLIPRCDQVRHILVPRS